MAKSDIFVNFFLACVLLLVPGCPLLTNRQTVSATCKCVPASSARLMSTSCIRHFRALLLPIISPLSLSLLLFEIPSGLVSHDSPTVFPVFRGRTIGQNTQTRGALCRADERSKRWNYANLASVRHTHTQKKGATTDVVRVE